MATIPPLPHLESPLDQYAKLAQLRSQRNEQQLQQQQIIGSQQDNQIRAQQLRDQQAMTAAMHEWDAKDFNSLPGLVLKHGASAQTVMGLKTGIVKQQTDLADLAIKQQQGVSDQFKNQQTQNDWMAQRVADIKTLPAEQQPQAFEKMKVDAMQRGYLSQQEAQQFQYQGPDQLALMEKGLMGHASALEAASKQAQQQEASARAREADINAQKTAFELQQEKQFGAMKPEIADAQYRAIQKKVALGQLISPDEKATAKAYEKQKELNTQVRVNAMGQQRQYPVFDNTTKTTIYMDPNEINEAKLREPGRYVVPQFSPEAITEQQTGKTFGPGGKGGEEALAFQTAMQHADLLKQAAAALNNGDTRAFNSLKNSLATQFGDADLTNMNAIKHVYENEVQKMIAGGHITNAEIDKNATSLPDNANFATISKVLDSYKALAQSKLTLRREQESLGKHGKSMTSAGTSTPAAQGGWGSQFNGTPHQ